MENRIDVATETLGKFQTFRFDCQLVAMLIHDVVQILTMQEINEIPESATYIEGVIHVRGSIIPAIDVRLRLEKIKKAYDDRACIFVVSIHPWRIGFIVDKVDAAEKTISPPPQIPDNNNQNFLSEIATVHRVVLIMDVSMVLPVDILMNIQNKV